MYRQLRGKGGKLLFRLASGRWKSLWRRDTSRMLLFFQTSVSQHQHQHPSQPHTPGLIVGRCPKRSP